MTYLIEKLMDVAIQIDATHALHSFTDYVFSKPHTKDMGYLIEKLIDAAIQQKNLNLLNNLAVSVFSKPHTKGYGTLNRKTYKRRHPT